MKLAKNASLLRGLAATMALLLALTVVGYNIAMSNIAMGMVDSVFGVDRTIYNDWTETVEGYTIPGAVDGYSYLKGVPYATEYSSADTYAEALKAHIVRQGEEGFALLKNDNNALPIASGTTVALFGWNGYNTPTNHTGTNANNADKITLAAGLTAAGIKLNETITKDDFSNIVTTINERTGRETTTDTAGMKKASANYTIPEHFEVNSAWSINKNSTTAIVMIGRGGGEGANYIPDDCTNAADPLALSEAELNMIRYAKQNCAKVVVLIVTANAMEIGPIAKGGELEVDAIGFCGIPNDYHYQGIANVLAGKVNATGALTDTFAYDNSFNPAVINMGQQQYSDLDTITSFEDPLGRNSTRYNANNYIVEAEGIYVGYKYYESRYYDSIANPTFNAKDPIGSTKIGQAWDYKNEVVYTFGQSLSYTPYTQELKQVKINLAETGTITATIAVKNEGTKEDTFLVQLYVNKPYTQYDIDHKVEKSAIDFLTSGKVTVKAGETKTIDLTLPTHYLASWDSTALNGAGTYVLDEGKYYFTAAAGAHEAVNSVLKAQGFTTDGTTKENAVVVWDEIEKFDDKTFSVSNGVEVRNQMENADINYFLGDGTVTYLSRSDYKATFPKNYTNYKNGSGIEPEAPFTISGAKRQSEWLTELINAQYQLKEAPENQWVKVDATLPATVGEGKQFATVWEYIMNVAITKPEAFNNIKSAEWQAVANAIRLDVAIASVGAGGHATKEFPGIGNPGSVQSESVSGYSQSLKLSEGTMKLNVCSNTLLAASFNPELAYEWGRMEGEGGLWLQKTNSPSEYGTNAVTVWGGGLNQHRTPYNGRNSEYMSEDPMLTNRIGAAQYKGSGEKGAINGPKHMGFNDQELNRQGNACYMTEQKVRETDTRCYEGAMRAHEGNATGVMMSFARIGATNCTNSVGSVKNIIREEWGFTGIITTDMGQGNGYHECGSMIMATINQYASMRGGNFFMGSAEAYDLNATAPNTRANLTLDVARKDPTFSAQARQTALYELYTIAHSGSGLYVEEVANLGEDIVVSEYTIDHHDPTGEQIAQAGWEYIFIGASVVFGILAAAATVGYALAAVNPKKEDK